MPRWVDLRPLLRSVIVSVLGIGLVVGLGACSGRDGGLPAPSSTSSTAPEATTTTIDYSAIPLESVRGETTTTFVQTGKVTLSGRVDGPDGPVAGAKVFVDRLVGDAVQPFGVDTIEDGTWMLEKLPGGRYRIRAAVPPKLTTPEPVIFYVEDGATRETALTLVAHTGVAGVAGTTPAAPVVGDTLNLAVQIVERYVDDDGIGRTRPVPRVSVRVQQSGWSEIDEPEGTTSEDGFVVFAYRCDEVGEVQARAVVRAEPDRTEDPDEGPVGGGAGGGGATQEPDEVTADDFEPVIVALDVPDCAPRPTTTTADPSTATTEE